MLSHKLQTKIYKSGYLELMNLPFTVGTQIEVTISKIKKKKYFKRLIDNDHVWTEGDIKAIRPEGKSLINGNMRRAIKGDWLSKKRM